MHCICDEIVSILTEILNTVKADSSSFTETFFSAFLGFGSAILVEELVNFRNTQSLKKQITYSLLNELEKIKETVNSLKDDETYFQPYSISMWKGACASGSILSLQNIKQFTELLNVFSTIEEANIIEKESLSHIMRLSEKKCSEEEQNSISEIISSYKNVLEDSRKNVKKSVEIGIKILKGEKSDK